MSSITHGCTARARLSERFSIQPSRLRWQFAHAALLGMLASGALAAEAEHAGHAEHAEAVELAPMVITGVGQQSPLTVVTDPKIPRQPMPASDGADYLKTIPGFSAVRNGGVNGDPVFRGMFGSRLKLLSNGGEMLGACPNRMDSPSSYISPDTFDKLTVIKGPQSVLWGPGASAATVLFERKPEQFSEPDYRLNGSLLTGSNGRFDRNLDAAAGNSQGYARLMANSSQADDYADGNGDTVPSRYDKWNTDIALGWTPDADTLVELTAGRGDGYARYAGRGMDGSQFQRESLGLRFEKTNLGETFYGLEAQVYYNYADHIMDNYSLRDFVPSMMMPNPTLSRVDRRTLGGRLVGTWQWTDVELKAGVDAQRSEHRKVMNPAGAANQMVTAAGSDALPWVPDAMLHSYGVFGELTWQLSEREKLISGLRLDLHEATDEREFFRSHDASSMPIVSRNWDNPTAGETRRDTLYSGFLRYEEELVSLPATWYAGLGHAERFPDYWELFVSNPGPVGTLQPFDSVRPEKTTQLDVGLQYAKGPLEAWVSAYAGLVEDYILFSYVPGVMPGMLRAEVSNIDATIAGAEMGASYRFTSNWKGDASLAYAWGKNRSDDRAMPQIPPLEGRLGLTYERDNWSTSGLWRVVASQGRVAENQGTVVGKDFDESAGFGVLAVNGAYRLNKNFKLSAGVDNLLDKAYSEHLNLAGSAGFADYGLEPTSRVNEPGRTYWARVDMSF
ncbi:MULTISPECIES: TonB-dependent copper receptor [Stutzerimonas stutzeri subgroup]|uniref:TonB-dependent copper receptor n=1 Tax=Stutzerimonas stutzeri subgroup TaxID=578833 RepID=UPI000C6C9169|nr:MULTISPECIES: TonB-dependent copper receptor [Stutzerimonas stutzeri subgroup]MCQ2047772.1 TonB-dependent copper receptor [Stutzerimonas kunmingensis]PKR28003.1 TonB-dependent copper receptor [Stutzerimonas stutzeri]QQC10565.1 TonB-dependent copper receptor [Stutzerimonas stutzeri]VEI32468.1 outer membrane protein OprC [Stutzerimonas stutzeri]